MVCVLDFKREVGLWHGVLNVSGLHISRAGFTIFHSLQTDTKVSDIL